MEKIIDIISLLMKKWLFMAVLKQNDAYHDGTTNQYAYYLQLGSRSAV
jgi:hypothetical protein